MVNLVQMTTQNGLCLSCCCASRSDKGLLGNLCPKELVASDANGANTEMWKKIRFWSYKAELQWGPVHPSYNSGAVVR